MTASQPEKKRRRPRGEGGLYQRKSDGLWCVSIEGPIGLDGDRKRKVIARKKKTDAMAVLREEMAKKRTNDSYFSENITLARWTSIWLDEVAQNRPKTMAGYKSVINAYINPLLGRIRLDQLKPEHVMSLHKHVLSTPKSKALRGTPVDLLPDDTPMLSSTYALNAHNILSKILGDAVKQDRISRNVCDMVYKPKASTRQRKALTLAQAIGTLEAASTMGTIGAIFATFLLTGARRGEGLGIEIERITDVLDLSWQLLRITNIDDAQPDYEYRHVRGSLYLARPKNDSSWRIIPLVDPLRSILINAAGGRTSGLLFLNDDGQAWDPDRISELWDDLMNQLGFGSDVVLHGSRHTVVDLLYEAGVPEAIIMEIVGHSVRSTTRGYRSKENMPQLVVALEKFNALLSGGSQKRLES